MRCHTRGDQNYFFTGTAGHVGSPTRQQAAAVELGDLQDVTAARRCGRVRLHHSALLFAVNLRGP